ncbi:unnamed protein product [Didymodactylos carnosus]|uniref:Reelin n=1 Tax=Didymodactylos carnosus TaxID=1234261 RepID=A0A815I6H1_9BILA|nr:unnamed protein product [Didymodactylos carnosus]CAF1364097.1 unnamed protein product [Didymodactylos carnosus]CAF4035311.1 unnamed protein product [Didymodactylos carnosus]CAF4244950.1 unnamed protein product [Didymodactylos carnosus]
MLEYIQFRWSGYQSAGIQWSMSSLFIGECQSFCHDRGVCTISGCLCTKGFSGKYCETREIRLDSYFNETFDDTLNSWAKLSVEANIRHVCETETEYLSGQALHFNGCGCLEAVTKELNISSSIGVAFAFHVTAENNCLSTSDNITVGIQWTNDEGITWTNLGLVYNIGHSDAYNITFSEKMKDQGIRLRWIQLERSGEPFWAIDNIYLY